MKLHSLIKRIKLDSVSRDVLIGLGLTALIGANLAISSLTFRLDLSQGRAYSLSPATVAILKSVKDPVEITFFVSDNIPTSFLTTKNQVRDLLTEFRRGSSQITLKYVDPKKDQKVAEQAMQEYGVAPTEFSSLESDQFAVSSGYFGIGLKVKDQKVGIPRIDPTNLEYNIVSSIYKLTKGKDIRIGLMGVGDPSEAMGYLTQILGQQFTLESVGGEASIPAGVKTIIALDGQAQPLTKDVAQKLLAFLKAGGKVVLFTSSYQPSETMSAAPTTSQSALVLGEFGITMNKDLVLSNQAEVVNFGADQTSRVLVRYPFWLMTNVFNSEATYTANVSYLTFPWASSLTLKPKEGVVQKSIVKSTPQSWIKTGDIDLNPQSITAPKTSDLKQLLLIAYGKLEKTNSELVVIPSTRFVQDNFLGRSGNLDFVINMVNELASDGALSGIRARSATAHPLPALSSQAKDMFKWGNVLVLPLLFGLYGFFRLKRRG